jgi:hypothetical protein
MRFHRTVDLRLESRSAQLAYAFIRGKLYSQTEPGCKDFYTYPRTTNEVFISDDLRFCIKRAAKLVKKYGEKIGKEFSTEAACAIALESWIKSSTPYVRNQLNTSGVYATV